MNTDTILAGVSLVAFVALMFVMRASRKRYRAWIQQPDVGVDVFAEDCTMAPTEAEWKAMYDEHFPGACGVCDGCEACNCSGCDECDPICGAPMAVDELAEAGIDLAYYGTRVVHRQCLTARRDGLTACSDCAKVLGAVAS